MSVLHAVNVKLELTHCLFKSSFHPQTCFFVVATDVLAKLLKLSDVVPELVSRVLKQSFVIHESSHPVLMDVDDLLELVLVGPQSINVFLEIALHLGYVRSVIVNQVSQLRVSLKFH
jgi:hypothetical protein